MSLFPNPIELARKEPIKNTPSATPKRAGRMVSSRPTPFTKEMKGEMNTALKKMFTRERENHDREVANLSYFAALDQMSSAGRAVPSASIEPSAQIIQLFEKMIGALTHIHQEGISETTIELTSDGFASSVFYGATITLTEYSTAPKVFNIHLSATPEGVALFEAHAGELSAALHKGNFGFGIHRLETELQNERLERPLPDHQSEERNEEGESSQ
ncbi:MAG: hypothetical protein K940chlam2_00998 [Chlamydiae bacterium]|nr:hypothetical protein [Chlamydiota bacterium]